MTTHNLTGALGALQDEYERAAEDLKKVLKAMSHEDFVRIYDTQTPDPDCRSVQTIMNHVIRAGYGYANYIRREMVLDMIERQEQYDVTSIDATIILLDKVLEYNAETLNLIRHLTEAEMTSHVILTNWGQKYDIDQLQEHAIVHVLRHRRQIVKAVTG